MSAQQLDLRRSLSLVRRHKRLLGVVVALGIVGGIAFALVSPPMLSAKALVVLPGARPNTATEQVIAASNPVLQGALPHVTPAMSLETLRRQVTVQSMSSNILSITAMGRTAAEAEANANAVANSYIAYIATAASPIGQLTVKTLEPANSATGTSRLVYWIVAGGTGAVAGALIGAIVAIALGRRDRRLRTRDAIANSIGVPVLASLPVGHPTSATEWQQLIAGYRPRPLYAWRLRKTLQQLALAGLNLTTTGSGSSVTVLSLSSDPRALALGPQLAAYAASQGIHTCLVVGQGEDARVTAPLRIAAGAMRDSAAQGGRLRVVAANENFLVPPEDVALTVVVAVIDGRDPRAGGVMHTTATVIAVSAGGATADQLALAAVTAAVDGREITGILVADPDREDHTTGRIPQLPRPSRNGILPAHATGTTEVRR